MSQRHIFVQQTFFENFWTIRNLVTQRRASVFVSLTMGVHLNVVSG